MGRVPSALFTVRRTPRKNAPRSPPRVSLGIGDGQADRTRPRPAGRLTEDFRRDHTRVSEDFENARCRLPYRSPWRRGTISPGRRETEHRRGLGERGLCCGRQPSHRTTHSGRTASVRPERAIPTGPSGDCARQRPRSQPGGVRPLGEETGREGSLVDRRTRSPVGTLWFCIRRAPRGCVLARGCRMAFSVQAEGRGWHPLPRSRAEMGLHPPQRTQGEGGASDVPHVI